MKSRFFSSFAVGLTVLFYALSLTSVNAQCNYTLEANDTFGDGWNGNSIDVLINGAVVLDDITFTAGSQATFSIPVNTGDQITTVWNATGLYGYETSYRILDVSGAEVGSGAETNISTAITASCPSCQPPTAPLVFGITSTTVDYSFTDGNGATEFEVSYGPTGFTAGAGTEFIRTSTNTGLSNLTAQTSYDVYVRAICAVGDTSPWSAVSSFTTLCNVSAVPYTQDFATFLPDACWDEATSGTPATGPSGFGAGNWRASGGAVRLNVYSNFLEDWVLSPSFDLGTGTAYQASFDFAIYSWQTTTGAACGSDDEFQFLITTDGGATWTPLFTADVSYGSAGLSSQAIDLSSYSGVVQFAFYGTDGAVDDGPDVDFFFDNFVIDELPACQAVTSLSTSNLSSSSVDLSFTDLNSGALGYIVSYTDGTTIDTISPNPTTTSVSISGLSASTSYTFSVEALCASGDTSAAATVSATTYGDCSSSGTYAYGVFSSISGAQTFVANTPGDWINLNFSAGATEACCDDWFITDGPNGTGNVIANGRGSLVGSYESQTGTISFYVVSDGSVNGTPFDYTLSCNPPVTCFPVRDLAAANITASSADVSWTDSASNAGTSEWEVSYGVSGFPVGSGTEVFVSTASASLSGLSAAVNYDVYVRAVCGAGDTSAWSQVSFQTACPVYATPYSMTFDLASTPLCWTNTGGETWAWQTVSGTGASTYANTPGGGDNTGNGGAFAALDGSGTNPSSPNLATLTSPSIDLSGLTNPRLRFYVFSNNTTAAGDNATFYAIVAGTNDTLVSYAGDDASWVELTADLSAYAGQIIAIEISGDHQTMTGSQFYNDLLVDDFFVEETPSCFAPSALTFSNLSSTSADVSWTDNNTPASSLFEVSIGASGFTAGSGTQTFVNTASESFSGLTAGTSYDVYVRANCGVNSSWSLVNSFTTYGDCSSAGVYAYSSNATQASSAQTFVANTPGDYITITFAAGATETCCDDWFITDGAAGTGNVIASGAGSIVGSYESITGTISFYVESDGSINGTAFDYALSCAAPPSCPDPSALVASNVAATSADLAWTENGSATEWEVSYGAAGFTAGSGTEVSASATSLSLTGLTDNTSYDVYVRSVCAVGDTSGWTAVTSFSTPCNPIAAPYLEEFSSGTLPNCWSLSATSGGPWVFTGTPGFDAANNGRTAGTYAWMDHSATDAGVVLEVGDVDISALTVAQLSFDYWHYSNGVMATPNSLFVEAWDGSSWNTLSTLSVDVADWNNYSVDISASAYSGSIVRIRFRAESGLDGFDYYGDQLIDNVSFEETPSCQDVASLAASATSSTSIEVSFVDPNSTAPANGFIVTYTDGVSGTTTVSPNPTASPFTISGLTAQTSYTITVQADCGGGSLSANAVSTSATTPCPAVSTFPWLEDFETTSATIGCWELVSNAGGANWQYANGNSNASVSAYSGSQNALFYSPTFATTNADLISPVLDLSGLTAPQLVFQHSQVDWSGDQDVLDVYYSTDGGSTFTLLDSYTSSVLAWTERTLTLPVSSSLQLYFSGTGAYGRGVTIDDVLVRETPSCQPPTALVSSNITGTSADVSWTDPNSASEWEVSYGASGFTAGAGTESIVSSASASLSGLTSATTYDVYVRAICSAGDTSAWSQVASFTTACPSYAAPYSQDFESTSTGSLPVCWSAIDGGTTDAWQVYSGYAQSGTNSAGLYTDFNNGNNDDYLITPGFIVTGNEQLIYSYRVRSSFEPNDFEVLLSTTGTAAADFTTTLVANASYSNTTYVTDTIDLSAYSNDTVYVAWHVPAGGLDGWYVYIDDVIFQEIPECLAPSNVAFSNITATTVDVTITDPQATAIQWSVDYGVGNTTDNNERFTSLTGQLTGLTPQTTYDLIVTTTCDGNVNSVSTSVYSFTTACGAQAVPYTTDFSTFLPDACWDEAGSGDPATGPSGLGSGDWRSSGGGARMNSYSNTDQEWMLTPSFDLGTGTAYQVEFDFAIYSWNGTTPATCGSDDEFQFLISTDGGSTWSALFTADNTWVTSAGGDRQIIDLTSYSGTVQFAFYATDGATDDPQDVDFTIDNFAVQTFTTCISPSIISASAVGATGADIGFIDNNGTAAAGGYEVEYGVTGFTLGTGTQVTTATSPASLTGLTAETTYDAYVRANCGGGDFSNWVGPVSFTTLRLPPAVAQGVTCTSGGNASIVFSESFETALTGWSGDIGTANGTWECPDGATSANTGANDGYNGGNYMNYEASSTVANQGTIVSPAIDLSAGADDAELSFWMHAYGADMGTLNVGVGSTATGPFTNLFEWTGQLQTSGADAWVNVGVDLSAYVGSTIYIAFTQYDTVTGNQYAGDMSIDEMTVTTCVACAAPSALTASNVAATSADLAWTENGSATEWEVSYGASGFTAGSGTEVSASATSLSLTGLTDNTSYDVYVRSVCSVGDTSDWSAVESFTTPCPTVSTFPWLEDFESTSATVGCWTSSVISGTSNWGTAASNTNGSITPYSGSSMAFLTASNYTSSADWISPVLDLSSLTSPQLTFQYASVNWFGDIDDMDVYYTTDGGTTFTLLDSYTAEYASWTEFTYTLPNSSSLQLYFTGSPDWARGLCLDDVLVRETPSCQDVTSLAASATGSTSLEVSFVDANSTAPANGFVVTYDDGNGAQTVSPNPTASPFTISGLTANTTYTITVQADCGTSQANAVSTTGTTDCEVVSSFPWTEDFESTSATVGCWTSSVISGTSNWGTAASNTNGSITPYSGSSMAFLTASNYTSSADWISPVLDLSSLTSPQLTFQYASVNWFGDIDDMDVYYTTDGGTTFTLLASYTAEYASWTEFTYTLPNSSSLQLYFTGSPDWARGLCLDDVVVSEAPSCFAPTALAASATSSSTADVSWTDPNSATEWEVSYGATGFTAGAGTEVSATSASATLSGLTAETGYDVYVRAICAVGDTSDWSAVASFTTPCAAIVPAYLEDFTAGYQPTSCWSQGEGGSLTAGPASTGTSGWNTDGLANAGTTGAARINIWGSSGTDWLITPSFDLSSGGPWEANFDVAVVSWNQTTPSFLDANNDFGLYASTDGGSTWTVVWSADENYVTNPGGNNETVDLSAYTGTVQFAFYAASNFGSADNDVSVDNFAIRLVNSNYTWSGASGTAWEIGANWAGGVAPQAITDVVIVPSTTNEPVITAIQSVGDLTVADNVTVTLNTGGELLVNGNLNLGSATSLTGDGSVNLTGGNSGTDLVINGSATIENLEVSSNYSLTSGILNITGGLFLDGGDFTGGINVVLNSDANGTAYLDDFSGSGGTYNGQITCQLYVPGTTGIQHFISSPVSTPNLTELADDLSGYGAGLTGTNGVAVTPTATCDPNALDPSSNYGNMFEWSASTAQNIACPQQGGWIVRSAGTMDNARGYSAYLTGAGATLDMSGTPNSGDVTINMASLAITNNTAMSNWDILGNPYPSGLDRNALITGNNTGTGLNSISYWNPSGTYSGTYAPYLPGDVIASFQGFSANWDGAGTSNAITFSNSMRTTATGTWRTGWYNERIDVELRGNGFADRTIILFADDATNGFDAMYDAEKFASASGQPTLYTGSSEHYALNSLAADAYGQSIPMGVVAGADGYFEFDFSTVENLPNGSMLYLEDLATGTWTNVSENPVYGFNMLATDASDRFILHFTPEVTATAVDGTCENADAYIELTFDGYQIAGQDVAWNYAVSKEGMAQAQGSMVSTIAIPVSESGIYNVDFTFGNATVNEVLSINVPVAPTAAIPAEVALSENEAITLNGMFTNANSYEWAVDGVVFSTEANPTWTASIEGIYNIAVTVRSEDGCSASDNMVAEVSKSVTSINDVNAVFQITQDAYSVVVLTDAEGFMIEMIAMDGKLVASARASQGANVISTQALAAGVYEVRLSSANGVVGSQKVLVK